jgi:hypothetical protein
MANQFDLELTSLIHYSTPAVAVPIFDFDGLEVAIPLNGQRTCKVTINVWDKLLEKYITDASLPFDNLTAFKTCLRVTWRNHPIFWGPVMTREADAAAGTVTLNAVDPSIRLQSRYIVDGDPAIDPANGFGGKVPPDYRGARLIRDSANLNSAQQTANWPILGIVNGSANTANPDVLLKRQPRIDQVQSSIDDITNYGPDWELEPDFSDPATRYCKLNVYDSQGTDKTATVRFQHGFGLDNLDNFQPNEGGKLITHSVVVGDDGRTRSDIIFHAASAQEYGIYMRVDSADYSAPALALDDDAARWVKAYARPPKQVTITLKQGVGPLPFEDFGTGDLLRSEGKFGPWLEVIDGRVVETRIKQADQSLNSTVEVDLVPPNDDIVPTS